MSELKGPLVRPVIVASTLDKRFRRAEGRRRTVTLPAHPAIVAMDLRRGCLATLERYLAGQPETLAAEVARELRNLISGAYPHTRFRMTIAAHPDSPKSKGGKPKLKGHSRSERDQQIAARYETMRARGDKRYIALTALSAEFDTSERSIRRALSSTAERLTLQRTVDGLRSMADDALRTLRGETRQGKDGAET